MATYRRGYYIRGRTDNDPALEAAASPFKMRPLAEARAIAKDLAREIDFMSDPANNIDAAGVGGLDAMRADLAAQQARAAAEEAKLRDLLSGPGTEAHYQATRQQEGSVIPPEVQPAASVLPAVATGGGSMMDDSVYALPPEDAATGGATATAGGSAATIPGLPDLGSVPSWAWYLGGGVLLYSLLTR